MQRYFYHLKKPKFFIPILVVGVVFFAWIYSRSSSDLTTTEVKKGEVAETVSITGITKASSFAELSFDQSGRVEVVTARVGSQGSSGQTLVTLDGGQARASLSSARANLDYQSATLGEARVGLVDTEKALDDALKNSYTKADDALKNYANRFFRNPETSPVFEVSFENGSSNVYFNLVDYNQKYSLASAKSKLNKIFDEWSVDVNSNIFFSDRPQAVIKTQSRLQEVQRFLNNLAVAVNSFDTLDFDYKATVEGYKTDVATARTNVNTAISNLTAAEKDWNAARLAVQGDNGAISTKSAEIKQAEAKVLEAEAVLRKLSLVSPISGVVTKQEAKVGETVTAGEIIVSILSPGAFEIEANVPEVQIGKIMIGNPVKVTFDAFYREEFTGHVFYIEPSETIADGVVNYKIKVALDKNDERLKNGLTANLEIITLEKKDVLVVPKYAVTEKDGKFFVQKKMNGDTTETEIMIGAEGSDGLVEVISGLNAGNEITVPSLKTSE